MYRHGLYVVGAQLKTPDASAEAASLGVYAIERFTEAEYLKQHDFAMPAHVNIRDALTGSFGPHLPDEDGPHDVVVEFSKDKAALVALRDWHPSQQVRTLPDGRVSISLRVPSLAPIVSWVLEWGPHARAVAPRGLVLRVARELADASAQYTRP
jgi:predicted DNA-binding transcriptional regulator YafY